MIITTRVMAEKRAGLKIFAWAPIWAKIRPTSPARDHTGSDELLVASEPERSVTGRELGDHGDQTQGAGKGQGREIGRNGGVKDSNIQRRANDNKEQGH